MPNEILNKLQELFEVNYKIQLELLKLLKNHFDNERQTEKEKASQQEIPSFKIDLPPMLTVSDVASFLNVSKISAYNLCHSKDFPCIHIGKRFLVPREQFLAWVRKSAEKGGSSQK